jgi:hypothetical protein
MSPCKEFSINCNKCKCLNKTNEATSSKRLARKLFVMCRQTPQEGLQTVQSVAKFQWHRCYKMAWNQSTLASQNFRLTWLLK